MYVCPFMFISLYLQSPNQPVSFETCENFGKFLWLLRKLVLFSSCTSCVSSTPLKPLVRLYYSHHVFPAFNGDSFQHADKSGALCLKRFNACCTFFSSNIIRRCCLLVRNVSHVSFRCRSPRFGRQNGIHLHNSDLVCLCTLLAQYWSLFYDNLSNAGHLSLSFVFAFTNERERTRKRRTVKCGSMYYTNRVHGKLCRASPSYRFISGFYCSTNPISEWIPYTCIRHRTIHSEKHKAQNPPPKLRQTKWQRT